VAFDYPIMLDLTGVRVLVIGGGRIALRKIEGLLTVGADVTVVAPVVDDDRELAVRVVDRGTRSAISTRSDW
jgi:precorrin-2 dehydrogenase/sirohydrochlorin ferrochelatase